MIQRVLSRGWICNDKKRLSFWNVNGSKNQRFQHLSGLWWKRWRRFGFQGHNLQHARASVVAPRLYVHKRQFPASQKLLILIWSSCSSSSSSSSQVNTARLRLMNVVPSHVSTMERVLIYRGATHAGVLQVCGHVAWAARCLCSLWHLQTFWTHLWREVVGQDWRWLCCYEKR